ncbi:nickel-responsive transcriptional regulator NikR [Campylobacter geochelonis]|uniref:Putative nickel-responsive regulator n=1 Tax=Campylobacter geochelonis TaxID=1780362 RepID=A0A128EKD4_9BACT|nr:nickel-responsive transcriptional regulator NikR [Campylobacter geochelonis]QKF71275.1 nickel responsive regulator [Campylobacter geochelonis]CZE48131.1 nickel responsive regulator [Campylobacter geochelonis]CZE49021.1 nickel responsive regulator [Campylobacter geochelonis]CZE51106.1 nickel responsive regulator [Campylobacter geochelonis]
MDDTLRFSISLPKNLLDEIDAKVAHQDYSSRSEFIRDLVRKKIVKDVWQDKENTLIGILTTVYNHHQSELVVKKMSIEHDAKVEISCTTHVHIDHENCLEVSVIKGKGYLIEEFANTIAGLKGVKFTKLTKAAIPKD